MREQAPVSGPARAGRGHGMSRIPALTAIAPAALLGTVAAAVLVLPGDRAGQTADAATQRAAKGTFTCNGPGGWAEVAANPNSFIVGNCRNGDQPGATPGVRTAYSDAANAKLPGTKTNSWTIARLGGTYNGCGVVKTSQTVAGADAGATNAACKPRNGLLLKKRDYALKTDCTPGAGRVKRCAKFDPDAHGDRRTVVTDPSCPIYANVRPFGRRQGPAPADPVGTLKDAGGPFWARYSTRGGQFVLGFVGNADPKKRFGRASRDKKTGKVKRKPVVSSARNGVPQWVFVERRCLSVALGQSVGVDKPEG